jgi:zinc/manganese transport system permease protein
MTVSLRPTSGSRHTRATQRQPPVAPRCRRRPVRSLPRPDWRLVLGLALTSAPVHFAFLVLVVLNLVAGFQALGTLLAVGMAILPAGAARFGARGIGALLAVAVAIAFFGSVAGLLASYHLGLAAGPAIVLSIGALYPISLLAGPRGLVTSRLLPRRHLAG